MSNRIDINKLGFEFELDFLEWLKELNIGIIVCAYRSNCVLSVGCSQNSLTKEDVLSIYITNMLRPVCSIYNEKKKDLWIGGLFQLWQYTNDGLRKTDRNNMCDFDVSFSPRRSWVLNDIDLHDIVLYNDIPYFISSLFCCIGTLSDNSSFKVFWKPPWISETVAEDRCHLNGLCCDPKGTPRYVTSVSRSNVKNDWKKHRKDGGVVYDIIKDKLICKGLSMPHSPRWHNGKLWILNSGTGYLGYIDFSKVLEKDGEKYHPFAPKLFFPSYIRGLNFIDETYAIIGGSQDRHEKLFQGLELNDNLEKLNIKRAKCGFFVVNIKKFKIVHHFEFLGTQIKEIYDINVIKKCSRPYICELDNEEILYNYKIDLN